LLEALAYETFVVRSEEFMLMELSGSAIVSGKPTSPKEATEAVNSILRDEHY